MSKTKSGMVVKKLAVAWLAAAFSIACVAGLLEASHLPFVLASAGGSAVILYGMPDSDMAQPRSFVGGHVIATLTGLTFLHLFGHAWWVMPLAVATALLLMQVTQTIHSPAGADPIIVIMNQAGWSFLLVPLGVSLALLFPLAMLFNNVGGLARYPRRWW